MSGRNTKRTCLIISTLTFAALLWRHGFAAEPQLLQRASFVVGCGAWTPTESGGYRWINDQEVLFYDVVGKTCLATRVELPTLQALTQQIRLKDALSWPYRPQPVSPDGRWLLMHCGIGTGVLDISGHGAQIRELPAIRSLDPLWQDNRHWLRIVDRQGKMYATLHGIDGTETPGPALQLGDAYGKKVVAITPQRHLLTIIRGGKEGDYETFLYDYDLNDGKKWPFPVNRVGTKIATPGDVGLVSEAELSPQGKRVAYLFAHVETPLPLWLRWLFPHRDQVYMHKVSIWVSGVDGSGMHEVGGYTLQSRNGDPRTYPTNLHWKPDGKHLSFLYRNGLYTVSAD